ncbi:hypothetical protein TWF225_002624 [Orbilia oligospora]|nr:hypothetical protein TWF225_002624 [Orbilia oligospora]KAF3235274.1 hypothetical protein TWF128_001902 [Orbilia oligospora]KAF3242066.1 hypothetical protein TWF217_011876 [Orbilia oligospora]KAF3283398.1 hypothetical protein TWF132_010346 [Orbilia oligospora]
MSHRPSDNAHPHESFHTPMQSINFASPTSPSNPGNPFHFGSSPVQQHHLSNSPTGELLGSNSQQAKRVFRPNPLPQRLDNARERRRNLILGKLQAQRENRAMQARGGEDEMLRLIYLSERNRWESGQERVAVAMSSCKPPASDEYEALHMADTYPAGHQDQDMAMVELMADVEEQELQEIINYHQSPDFTRRIQSNRTCPGCKSDEILESPTEAVCFNCGISIDR